MINKNQKLIIPLVLIGGLLLFSPRARGPRGVRYNNPGNIKFNPKNNWRGQIGPSSDGFVIFDSPINGFRAMAKLISNYYHGRTHDGKSYKSVAGIIEKYAPRFENPTDNYIAYVTKHIGVPPHIQMTERGFYHSLPDLVHRMSEFEVGRGHYTYEQAKAGVERV